MTASRSCRRGLGLAPSDTNHAPKQVPQGPIEEERAGYGAGPAGGGRWQGRGVAFPKKPEWRLECTLLACWEEGYDEPWFLVTDLDPDQAEGLWYGMRSWIEGGFKLLKSDGWQWQATRMTRSGSCGAVVAGAGGGDAVRAGSGRGGRRGGVRRRGGPRAGGPAGTIGHRTPAGAGYAQLRAAPRCGGPGRSSAWSACSDKAWRCC